MIWFLRATSQEIKNSSLTRVCFLVRICPLANSSANFLHLEAQIRRNLALKSGVVSTDASVTMGSVNDSVDSILWRYTFQIGSIFVGHGGHYTL